MKDLSVQERAEELSKKYKTKVSPIVFIDEDTQEEIIGFIKEPARMVKLRVMDKAMTSPMTASSELFETIFLEEDSDKRIMSEDTYYLGATMEAFKTVEMAVNTFKKK
jgi:siroheme synthase